MVCQMQGNHTEIDGCIFENNSAAIGGGAVAAGVSASLAVATHYRARSKYCLHSTSPIRLAILAIAFQDRLNQSIGN